VEVVLSPDLRDLIDTYTDEDGNIFERDIEWSAARIITPGCNPPTNNWYCPTGIVTHGEMAAYFHCAWLIC
jgi:hypothetical protein